jgi:uncharacterized protein DUF3800
MVNQKVAARLQVGPNCLLFFIDETGHETFADKHYPVFGLGGCAINSSSAAAVIAEPWRAMKAAHFGGEDVPLHANELRNPQLNSSMPCQSFSASNSLRALR